MKSQKIYLFGYGSLMNPRSLARTLPGERIVIPAILQGYRRRMNIAFGEYAYLNIIPDDSIQIKGVLIELSESEFELFIEREKGYTKTDITESLMEKIDGRAYAFIAPNVECALKVPRSYIVTCTSGMSDAERELWIKETIMNEIEEDMGNPVYENAAD